MALVINPYFQRNGHYASVTSSMEIQTPTCILKGMQNAQCTVPPMVVLAIIDGTYISTYGCMYVHVCMHVCMYVCTYVTHVCMYVYMHMHD